MLFTAPPLGHAKCYPHGTAGSVFSSFSHSFRFARNHAGQVYVSAPPASPASEASDMSTEMLREEPNSHVS
jgi:hypothetical protein